MKNTTSKDKTKAKTGKSARLSIRTSPEVKAKFVKLAKAQGCTQDSLFTSMLQNFQSCGKKIPPMFFVPIDDAINLLHRDTDWLIDSEITRQIQIIKENTQKIKKELGYGG